MSVGSKFGHMTFTPFGGLGAAAVPVPYQAGLVTPSISEQLRVAGEEVKRAGLGVRGGASTATSVAGRTDYAVVMVQPVTGTVGAWIRVAYWLAVGSQILNAKGQTFNSTKLAASAANCLVLAASLTGKSAANYLQGWDYHPGAIVESWLTPTGTTQAMYTATADAAATKAVLQLGAKRATSYGLTDVASVLNKIAGFSPRPEEQDGILDRTIKRGGEAFAEFVNTASEGVFKGAGSFWTNLSTPAKAGIIGGGVVLALVVVSPYVRAVGDVAGALSPRR